MSQEDVSKQIETARRQLGAQRPDLAIQTLQAIVHQAPNEADARNLLGVAYSMTGNAQAAEASLRQALSLMPHNPDILSNLAQHLAAGKRFEEAGALWQQALRSRPDHTPSRVGLNQLDKMRDNAVEALDFVEAQEIGVSRATAGWRGAT